MTYPICGNDADITPDPSMAVLDPWMRLAVTVLLQSFLEAEAGALDAWLFLADLSPDGAGQYYDALGIDIDRALEIVANMEPTTPHLSDDELAEVERKMCEQVHFGREPQAGQLDLFSLLRKKSDAAGKPKANAKMWIASYLWKILEALEESE